jgi:hypothetical protein
MRPEDYGKSIEERMKSVADWAVFEALSELMAAKVSAGKYMEAEVISKEITRYLRGEGWSWNDQE